MAILAAHLRFAAPRQRATHLRDGRRPRDYYCNDISLLMALLTLAAPWQRAARLGGRRLRAARCRAARLCRRAQQG